MCGECKPGEHDPHELVNWMEKKIVEAYKKQNNWQFVEAQEILGEVLEKLHFLQEGHEHK